MDIEIIDFNYNNTSKKIPLLDVIKLINEIENFDFANSVFPNLEGVLESLMNGVPNIMARIPAGKVFERIVKVSSKPNLLSEISYPPNQGANLRGKLSESIFYCSNDMHTALLEKEVNCGDVVVIGRWVNSNYLTTNTLGIKIQKKVEILNPTGDFNLMLLDEMAKKLTQQDLLVHDFAGRMFLMPRVKNNTKLINAIANIYYNDAKIHSIAYPSVMNNYKGINYGIKSSYINSGFLLLDHAILVQITKIGTPIEFNIIDYAEPSKNNYAISWVALANSFKSNSLEDVFFSDIEGSWVAYNKDQEMLEII